MMLKRKRFCLSFIWEPQNHLFRPSIKELGSGKSDLGQGTDIFQQSFKAIER